MSLKSYLVWYWDLDAAAESITDLHNGLSLSRVGTTDTVAGGGPGGRNCIRFINTYNITAGKYRNTSVPKSVAYESGFSVNIWTYTTGISTLLNVAIAHRNAGTGASMHFQVMSSSTSGEARVVTYDAAATGRFAESSSLSLNTWRMLTQVDDGSECRLYVNGAIAGSSGTTLGSRESSSASSAGFAIGGQSWSNTNDHDVGHRGRLALAGVWAKPLTTDEIAELYNDGSGLSYKQIVPDAATPHLIAPSLSHGVIG